MVAGFTCLCFFSFLFWFSFCSCKCCAVFVSGVIGCHCFYLFFVFSPFFSEVRVWDGRKEREGEGKEICRSDFWNILIERVEWKGSYNCSYIEL